MGRKPHRDPQDPLSPQPLTAPLPEVIAEGRIRPVSFEEFVGQRQHIENLRVYVSAARARGGAVDHILFSGPPGLGKTTLSHIIAAEMGTTIHRTSGPAVEHKGMLAGLLTNLNRGDVLFIDELHRLPKVVQESLYSAMEDFKLEVLIGEGPHAQAIIMDLAPFTLVGATTRSGLLTAPLRTRFGIPIRLEFYGPDDLTEIVLRSAGRQGIAIAPEGALEIGRRSRGTPRIAIRLLARVRDFAEVSGAGIIDRKVAASALTRLEVDEAGLDPTDRAYLTMIIERFGGGPAGIEAIAAGMGEERDTLEEVCEPYLLQQGYIQRTPKGRIASRVAFSHLGFSPPATHYMPTLFSELDERE
ncbi:MAG: Holliday junction branch migration DNA helicase RuvB [Deltaproteobacteria bacterium HGW-Deltaproteobacteria-22]|nr:Holliday junction branch migration DNA helicase RuvB [Myxococcota bacterium]PKN16862.1 MAG: Holliday junction branch migration DNA helicase RuvB [Deltaproteobacteria bacterium HGW-Deltaproteobacteria-22]